MNNTQEVITRANLTLVSTLDQIVATQRWIQVRRQMIEDIDRRVSNANQITIDALSRVLDELIAAIHADIDESNRAELEALIEHIQGLVRENKA